jgi:hypothetical protein
MIFDTIKRVSNATTTEIIIGLISKGIKGIPTTNKANAGVGIP